MTHLLSRRRMGPPLRRRPVARGLVAGLLVAGLMAACGDDGRSGDSDSGSPPGDAGLDAGDGEVDAAPQAVEVVILHTADEHGWLQPYADPSTGLILGGAANMAAWWASQESFDPSRDLLLSSGDNWTGPAISTWFEGEPMVDAFNLMGYHASAVGNHEFDFGRDTLRTRLAQAAYPYLAANVTYDATQAPLEGTLPWVLLEANGVQVGVIGLSSVYTPTNANPLLVSDLDFADYASALAEHVPAVRAAGADLVVLLTHACTTELAALVSSTPVAVDLAFAGHCHQLYTTDANGIPIVASGANLRSYTATTISYDLLDRVVIATDTRTVLVQYAGSQPNPVTPDADLLALAAGWQAQADQVLGQVIGYTATGIPQGTWLQGNWVADTWLWAYPGVDVAVQNFGGLRQSIPPGDITVGDIVDMMPFDNVLYEVQITGAELVENLQQAVNACAVFGGCYPSVAGMTFTTVGGAVAVTLADSTPLDPATVYRVLVSDFLYNGGSGYLFHLQDPDPIDLAQNYRQPVIDWTVSQGTSPTDPLEAHLDPDPRN